MLTSLLQLFKRKVDLLPKEEVIWVKEKQKFNVKKAFATFRMKNGENIISKVITGTVSVGNYNHFILTGNTMFNRWIYDINSLKSQDYFLQVKEDRYVRIGDIMDIIGLVESDHEIEVEISVKKIFRSKE